MKTVMKMAPLSTTCLFLLCCSFIILTESCDQYAVSGSDLNLPLKYRPDKTDILRWKHNDSVIFRKEISKIEGKKEETVHQNGSLKRKNLNINMSGIYKPEVFGSNGKMKNVDDKGRIVCVIDGVQKPTVTVECLDSDVRFNCNVTKKQTVQNVSWSKNGQNINNKDWSIRSVAKEVIKDSFTCRVSNPASFALSEPVKQNCYKSSFPEELYGISIWVFVGGGGGIVLVLIIIVVVCCIRSRRVKRLRLKEEGELRLEWTNTQQQQHQHQYRHPLDHHHHHHHHHPQQQPAGHTGPRPSRSKQRQPRHPVPETPGGQPKPSPHRPPQASRAAAKDDEEQPPPLPQPRKKRPRAPRAPQ